MKTIKKYTAIQIEIKREEGGNSGLWYDNTVSLNPAFTYGWRIKNSPDNGGLQSEFDTEEEATQYAAKINPKATWLIVPVIRFDNFDND